MIDTALFWIKERSWLALAAGFGALSLLVILGHFIPGIGDSLGSWQTIRMQEEKIRQATESQAIADDLMMNKQAVEKKIEQFVISRGNETQLSELLAFISRCAKDKGVQLLTIEPDEMKVGSRYVEIPIYLTLNARFHHLGRFLNMLETSGPIIQVRSLNIKTKGIASNSLDVELDLCIYCLGESR